MLISCYSIHNLYRWNMNKIIFILLFASSLFAQTWTEIQPAGDADKDWQSVSIYDSIAIAGVSGGRLYRGVFTTTSIKKVLGVSYSNIKKINGVSKSSIKKVSGVD